MRIGKNNNFVLKLMKKQSNRFLKNLMTSIPSWMSHLQLLIWF